MQALIAYFSRAGENYFSGALRTVPVGNTELAARMLRELTGAALFKIEPLLPYSDDYNECIRLSGLPQLLGHHAHAGVHLSGAL